MQDPETLSNRWLARAASLGPKRWPIPLLSWGIGVAWAFGLDDPRLRFPSFLAAWALMVTGWIGLAAIPRISGTGVAFILGGAALARAVALGLPPAFSDDVYRYVFEGRAVWWMGPAFPFAHPPIDAPRLGVPQHLLDEAWLRINHAHISTIYPPAAQLVFALAGGAGELVGRPLLALKAVLVAADLGVAGILWRRSARAGLFWIMCPLVVLEIGREGHADSLSALGLALGIAAFAGGRPRLGYFGFGVAALAKLNGLVACMAAARSTRRGMWIAVLLGSLLLVPLVGAGSSAGAGLSEYASRWRAGDGVFSILLAGAEAVLGGEWRRLGDRTLTSHQLARGLAVLSFVIWAFFVLRRPSSMDDVPGRAGILLLGLLLLGPTLHPWYVVWLVPFAAIAPRGRTAIVALASLAPLLHHPSWLELETGRWTDLGWVRALIHVPVWVLLAVDLVRRPALGHQRGASRP